jgi:hypothetical protein
MLGFFQECGNLDALSVGFCRILKFQENNVSKYVRFVVAVHDKNVRQHWCRTLLAAQ